MSDTVIKVEDVSKQYRLGSVGTGSFAHDLNKWWHTVRGKENPYLKIGETNDRTSKGSSEYVWSLKDINFEIQQGDAVGIIGRNGAGKSTLLKILSRVTAPTTGSVKVKGRIASLLEVGTGFHPELSGRENIFLNGSILGMRKREIAAKFDEIVDFAGVERYIDTPVKRYSSGMYVRLAFAVAAHLESEILIVDEVLAVGDAEFQKKCLGKMNDVSKGEGRTLLFVSHNMNPIQKLCDKGLFLSNGAIRVNGSISEAIDKYLENKTLLNKFYKRTKAVSADIRAYIKEVYLHNSHKEEEVEIQSGEPWTLHIVIQSNCNIEHFIIGVSMTDKFDSQIRTSWSDPITMNPGTYEFNLTENNIYFAPGSYNFDIAISSYHRNIEAIKLSNLLSINDTSVIENNNRIINLNFGVINNQFDIQIKKLDESFKENTF